MSDVILPAHDALVAENALLRRRLERERAARREAEEIAERGLRALYEHQRQLAFLEQIATAANQTRSVADTLRFVVQQTCAFTGWPVGHVLLTEDRGGGQRLRSAFIWHASDAASVAAFRAASEAAVFDPGSGLPGRVQQRGTPVWLADIATAPWFFRGSSALACGLRAAFGFPVLAGADVAAVLEFYTTSVVPEDATLLGLMAQVGTQLGRVIERDRTQDHFHRASHDDLTGLPNRAQFLHRLDHAITRSRHDAAAQFAVLFIDLDQFKLVNDSLGHAAGDALLIQVAGRLGAALRSPSIVPLGVTALARLGGDEFTVLLTRIATPDDAVGAAEVIQERLRRPFVIDGQEVVTTASIGITTSSNGYGHAVDVLRDADLAMYRAKSCGKARSAQYHRAMYLDAQHRLALESDLRRALRLDQFVLHYQPIVSLASGATVGFEALVRWQKAANTLVYPNDFIRVAEETGLIIALGMWVLREACRTAHAWHSAPGARGEKVGISVNLSARQFAQPDLVEQITRILRETGIDPTTLRLEITETTTMEDAERASRVLAELRALGLRISLDDFGTGFSSLSYLHRFPLDLLKIDRSFVSRMDRSGEALQIIQTIMSLARSLGMEVIAEGVETAGQVARLRALGCDYCQGYFFSRPLSAEIAGSRLKLPHHSPPAELVD